MKVKVGDKIRMMVHEKSLQMYGDVVYTVVEVQDQSVKLKHPDVGGYFIFARDRIAEVLP
tara:strand:- start:9318 stop:9497 length:180 start_codon:yes stop_codon:yes gene_type:complete